MSGFDVNLYFSGTPGGARNQTDALLIERNAFRLHSFAYPKEAPDYLRMAEAMGCTCRMIIDSGAFTSWSVGKPVKMPDLIAYNKKLLRDHGNKGHEFLFISLDVIPGERGRRATSEEISAAVKESFSNFKVMQQELAPYYVLPVYHSGEDPGLRDAYLRMTDYVCLSMDQGMSEYSRLEWAKRSIVDGYKFHGLAATGNKMVTQIGWYSVDSSTWLTVGSMGNILWPQDNGTFRVLPVSPESPNRHQAGQHLNTLTPYERARVVAIIEEAGYIVDDLCTDYKARHVWNINQWLNPPWKTTLEAPMDLFS